MNNSLETNKFRVILRSIALILVVTILQPQIVLFGRLGISSKCQDCSIWGDTFLDIVLFLILPLSIIYLVSKGLKLNVWLSTSIIVMYFAVLSFLKLTVPLFEDRIASWSTYSDEEAFSMALLTSFRSIFILSAVFFLLLARINRIRN